MVASTSLPPGAEMITFFAPPLRCADAFSLVVKRPVHSSTTSTPSALHGSCGGSRCASTLMRSPLTTMRVAVDVDLARKLAVRRVVARQVRVGLRAARGR